MIRRFAVTVKNYAESVHVGGDVMAKTYLFTLPPQAQRLITRAMSEKYQTVSLSLICKDNSTDADKKD